MSGNSSSQGRFAREQIGHQRGRHRQTPDEDLAAKSRHAAELGELARLINLYPEDTHQLLQQRVTKVSSEGPAGVVDPSGRAGRRMGAVTRTSDREQPRPAAG